MAPALQKQPSIITRAGTARRSAVSASNVTGDTPHSLQAFDLIDLQQYTQE